jgi:hypothetical protein
MMKKHIILAVICLALLLPAGCGGMDTISAAPGEEFTLVPGQSAVIEGAAMKIRFVEVTGDSRCPEGATCIREGEASSLVKITYAGVVNDRVLVQPGGGAAAEAEFGSYVLTFDLTPYPEAGKEIAKADYRLHMKVTRR